MFAFKQKFNEKKRTKSDVTKNPRAMAKLLKEANRVKKVLSANVDHTAQVSRTLLLILQDPCYTGIQNST